MDLNKINKLLDNYFEGETSLVDEKILKDYFKKDIVAPQHQQYKALFGYYTAAQNENYTPNLFPKKETNFRWAIAASIAIVVGLGTFYFLSNEKPTMQQGVYYGTCQTPEQAMKETQQALALVANHVNKGVKSVGYVNEYNKTHNLIFK